MLIFYLWAYQIYIYITHIIFLWENAFWFELIGLTLSHWYCHFSCKELTVLCWVCPIQVGQTENQSCDHGKDLARENRVYNKSKVNAILSWQSLNTYVFEKVCIYEPWVLWAWWVHSSPTSGSALCHHPGWKLSILEEQPSSLSWSAA